MSCAPADELEPPWVRHPWIPLGSIGWRMGTGESYLMEWSTYVEGACANVENALAYLHRHPPAPRSWDGWIASWLAEIAGRPEDGDEDEDGEEEVWLELVEEEQLTADDAAYPVFVANALRAGGMEAPWVYARDPREALRYSARELGWWARWLVSECADRATYLDAQPAPGPAWLRVASSARTGEAVVPHGGAEGLVCTLVTTGTLPPPWLAGHAPREEIEYGEAADDRDFWHWWTSGVFDDAASLAGYLAAWPPAPAGWTPSHG